MITDWQLSVLHWEMSVIMSSIMQYNHEKKIGGDCTNRLQDSKLNFILQQYTNNIFMWKCSPVIVF